MKDKRFMKIRLTSFQIIILGFAGVILIGALLLMLPISSRSGQITSFSSALFTSTSAVCVTGLVLVDTATYWSYFGQAVILLLIQVGGLGVITVASLIVLLAGGKISFSYRQTMQNAMSAPQVGGIVKLTRFMIKAVLVIEVVGAILLIPFFCRRYGVEGVWLGVFHAVSAFCNAGFDLMGSKTGQFSSLTAFSDSAYLTIVICLLILAGGLGFITWDDIIKKRFRVKEYRMQSKVILATTMFLLVIPFAIFFCSEFSDFDIKKRICASIFQAVTPRTAGFNTADYSVMSDNSKAVSMILMLIGGSPGSTAGGMKTTTIAILVANAIAVFRRRNNANYFGRRVEDSVVKNAAAIFFLYMALSMLGSCIICMVEGISLGDSMFEAFSAIATVGLSLGLTPGLSIVSQTVLILLMFFGRVGGLTMIYAAFSHRDTYTAKYPVENIMVG